MQKDEIESVKKELTQRDGAISDHMQSIEKLREVSRTSAKHSAESLFEIDTISHARSNLMAFKENTTPSKRNRDKPEWSSKIGKTTSTTSSAKCKRFVLKMFPFLFMQVRWRLMTGEVRW